MEFYGGKSASKLHPCNHCLYNSSKTKTLLGNYIQQEPLLSKNKQSKDFYLFSIDFIALAIVCAISSIVLVPSTISLLPSYTSTNSLNC